MRLGRFAGLATMCLLVASPVSAQTEGIVERYEKAVRSNPVNGLPLERIWKFHRDQGTLDRVLERYRQEAETNATAALILGHLLKRSERYPEAEAAYQKAAALTPQEPLVHRALADIYLALNRKPEAAAALSEAATRLPATDSRKIDWWIEAGDLRQALGDPQGATEAWSAAASLAPGNLDLRLQLAQISEKNQQITDAIGHYEVVAARGSPYQRAIAYREIARIEQGAQKFDAAVAALDRALQLTGPGNWLRQELQARVIQIYQEAGRVDDLEQKWRRLVEANPRDLGARQQLADFYSKVGRPVDELHVLEQMLALAPNNTVVKVRVAELLAIQGDLPESAGLYDQLLTNQPDNVDYQFARARLDVQAGQLDRAQRRISDLLARRGREETVRRRALEFLNKNRLVGAAEELLRASVAEDRDENTPALMRHLLRKQRFVEARITAEQWFQPDDTPAQRLQRLLRCASIFKEGGYTTEAEALLRLAVQLDAASRDAVDGLLDLLINRKAYAAARELVNRSFEAEKDPVRQKELDRKLFNILIATGKSSIAPASATDVRSPELEEFVSFLERAAATSASPELLLRLSTWKEWTRDLDGAVAAARRAVELGGNSTASRERLAELLILAKRSDEAADLLKTLLAENSARSADYLRRLANLYLDQGRNDEALQYLTRLKSKAGNDVQALTELAAGLQRISRPAEALEAWERVYNQATGQQKREALTPMVRILGQLGQGQEAGARLLAFFDAQSEPDTRKSVFDELLEQAAKSGILSWLEQEMKQRRNAKPNDYFLHVAVAKVVEKSARTREAYELLSKAHFCAPDAAGSLRLLVAEAEKLGDFEAAKQNQRRLTFLSDVEDPEPLLKLAVLEENDFADAAQTWQTLITRFPRNAEVLGDAAAYFDRKRETRKVIDLLERVIDLDPANVDALHRLASIQFASGDIAAARTGFEHVLEATIHTERPGEIQRFPIPDHTYASNGFEAAFRLRDWPSRSGVEDVVREFWRSNHRAAPSGSELDRRLDSVAKWVACVRRAYPADWKSRVRTFWSRRTADEPNATLWAFFCTGDWNATLSVTTPLITPGKDNRQLLQAHLWYALQAGRFELFRPWIQPDDPSDSDLRILALATLSNFLQTRPKERLERFVPSIFAEGQGTRQALWETARIYAAADRFEQAIRLGRRALALAVTRKCELAKEVARWCVLIDQPEQAEQVLKDALLSQRERRGEEYLTCLRMYFDLLPDADREHLTAQFVESLRRPSTYRRDALPAVFLLGWSGYKREAMLVLDELFRQPAWSGYETWSASDNLGFRTWQFAVEAGQQLIAFQLEPLAEHLWTKLLADRAMIELQGQQSREAVQGLRLRLVQMQLTRAKPSEASAILDRIEAEGDGPVYSVSGLAAQLETARQFRLSALAYRRLYDATPSDPNIYRSLQEVIQRTGDNLLQEDLLSGIAEGRNPPPEGTERWEIVLRLADLYSQTGRPVASKATLEAAAKREPRETRYLEALAKHPEVDPAEAESIWKRLVALEPGRPEYVQALASFYQRSGRTQEALELANAAPPTENRDFSNPQPTAEQLTERAQSFLRRGQPANVGSIATDLRNMGLQNDAIRLMRAAVQTARDPNIKFLLQQQLVTDFLAGGQASIAEDLDYLQELATIHPSLSLQYYQALAKLTKSASNDAKGRLETAWSDGDPVAGEVLIQLLLSLGQEAEAEKLLNAVVQHPEIADNALSRLQLAFSQASRPRFAARVIEEQIARNRGDLRFQFALCNQLWKAGEKARVSAIVEDVAKRAPIQNDILARIANFFSSGRDPDLARQWLERAIGADPDAARSDLRVQYARLLIEQGRLGRAGRVLRSVELFRTDSVFNDYIELSTRAGLADEWYGEIPFLWRSTARSVWTANFEHWLKEGATDRAAKALETYPGFARGALKYGSDLLARAPASTAKVLEDFFADAVLEKNESEAALQLADEAQQRNRGLAVKALEAVIRSSRNELSERARARLASMR